IARALVYSYDNRLATLTDGEGHFEFRREKVRAETDQGFVSPRPNRDVGGLGSYRLAARKAGYLSDPASAGDPPRPGVDRTILLIPEAIIQGRLLISGAELPPTIPLQLYKRQISEGRPHWMSKASAHTDSSGQFRFAELEPGEYKIMTLEQMDDDPAIIALSGPRFGFPPSCFPGVADFSTAAPIQLTIGQIFDATMTLSSQPYFAVKVPIANVEAISGLRVSVFARGHSGPGYSLGYNPNQHRIEGLLPNGSYFIQVTAWRPYQVSGTTTISVAGRDIEGPTLALSPTSSIAVRVREEFTSSGDTGVSFMTNGHRFRRDGPRAYLQIYLEPADDFALEGTAGLAEFISPDDNSLAITNALPGRYWVHVRSLRGYAASVTAGNVDLRQDPLVVLLSGNPPIEITMRDDAGRIEGTVVGQHSGPSPTGLLGAQAEMPLRAWIYCIPLPGSTGEFQQLSSSAEGAFTSAPMAPGGYRLLAFDTPQPELAYRDSEAMRASEALGRIVNLGAGQSVHVDLELISSSTSLE
ncbi:MAG: hypothetical protein JO356_12035, partial [Acidobacteria bacterium]|nr:hypothetical protein [Acidobacteriota bacterium]